MLAVESAIATAMSTWTGQNHTITGPGLVTMPTQLPSVYATEFLDGRSRNTMNNDVYRQRMDGFEARNFENAKVIKRERENCGNVSA